MWTSSFAKRKVFFPVIAAAILAPRAWAAPISSLNVVFTGTNKIFTAGITTNTAGSGQIWVQAFTSPDGNETINLELLENGSAVPNAMSPASLTTQAGLVTYGFPGSTPLPITFFHEGTGLTIRATLSGSTITRESASFTVVQSSPTKLLLLAPGQTFVPGTNPATTTGKGGLASVQDPSQPFALTAILTDNSYNKVASSTHTIAISAGDLTVLPGPGVLTNGSGDFLVKITGARTSRTFTATDVTDTSILSGAVEVTTAGPPEEEVFPYPSPFNPLSGPAMTLRFHLNNPGTAKVKVTDQFGQLIWEYSTSAGRGFTNFTWDGRNANGTVVAAGVYYAVLEIDGSVKSKKRFGVIK